MGPVLAPTTAGSRPACRKPTGLAPKSGSSAAASASCLIRTPTGQCRDDSKPASIALLINLSEVPENKIKARSRDCYGHWNRRVGFRWLGNSKRINLALESQYRDFQVGISSIKDDVKPSQADK